MISNTISHWWFCLLNNSLHGLAAWNRPFKADFNQTGLQKAQKKANIIDQFQPNSVGRFTINLRLLPKNFISTRLVVFWLQLQNQWRENAMEKIGLFALVNFHVKIYRAVKQKTNSLIHMKFFNNNPKLIDSLPTELVEIGQ